MEARILRMCSLTLALTLILVSIPGVGARGSDPCEQAGGTTCDHRSAYPKPQAGQLDPENVEFVAQVEGATAFVVVRGSTAHTVVDGAFTIIDISRPATPVELGMSM